MQFSDLLNEERIIPHLAARDKREAIEELVGVLVRTGAVQDGPAVIRALFERENLGSTGIGDGLAIPHARLRGMDEMIALLACSPEGVEFDSIDGKPVRLLVLLLAPEKAAATHLRALALVSRLLKSPEVREELLRSDTAAAIAQVIARHEGRD